MLIACLKFSIVYCKIRATLQNYDQTAKSNESLFSLLFLFRSYKLRIGTVYTRWYTNRISHRFSLHMLLLVIHCIKTVHNAIAPRHFEETSPYYDNWSTFYMLQALSGGNENTIQCGSFTPKLPSDMLQVYNPKMSNFTCHVRT